MRNTTFMSSMVLSVACVSAANATVVYDTIDPFTTPASADTRTGISSGSVDSVLTGTLWDGRSIKTTTTSASRASASMTIGTTGSAVFGVTQVGSPSTAVNNVQKGYLDYYSTNGPGPYPDFTNFTSLDFNYVSTLSGTLKCKVYLIDAGEFVVEKAMGASGLMSFSLADFGGITQNIEAMGGLTIVFERSGSNASGSLTITNLVANGASVPAPGAIALLGAAGLVGARRRRA